MYRLNLTRNLRTLALLLALAVGLSALGVILWANYTGMPESWRAAIEREVARQGAHVKIGGLRYLPLQGVIAYKVQAFSDARHLRETARLERLTLDFDITKLASGVVHLNKIQLNGARLRLPVDPRDPQSEALEVTDINGALLMPGDRRLELRDARGKIAGINVALSARIIGYEQDGNPAPDESKESKRRELLAQVLQLINQWHFSPGAPPVLQISVEGDINDRSTFAATLGLKAKSIEKNGHKLNDVSAEATLNGDLLTVTRLHASDSYGQFEGHLDYDLHNRDGRFDLSSSLELSPLITAWLGRPLPMEMQIRGQQRLEAEGSFLLDDQNIPQVSLTGHARGESVRLKTMHFSVVESGFSWHHGNLFLRDLNLIRADGKATGKVMVEWPLVRLVLHTTLPVPVYRPFVAGLPLEMVLHDFTEQDGAAVDVSLEGSFSLTDHFAWSYTGSGCAKKLRYKGVPFNTADCKFSLNHHELDFYDGSVEFDYTDYPLRKDFNGPAQGTAKIRRIRYDAPSKTVEVDNVRGTIWAAPMVRLFAPKVADSLEKYRFHQPPELKASGAIDVTPDGRTDLQIAFSSDHPADYPFLGQNLTLGRPRGQVKIRGDGVLVSNLNFEAFGGPVVAEFNYLNTGKLEGELSWTQLSIAGLTTTYGFNMKGGGSLTGRTRFSLTDERIETMNGEGLLAFDNAELFSVPMFGPLTPLIAGVLNDGKAGSQPAKNAFGTFKITDGVVSCKDFQTTTTSLSFTGEGALDLRESTIDMTMRMNARGLLGLITLPLRPLAGLFQFRGAGPLKQPQWENIEFSPPPAVLSGDVPPSPPPKAMPIDNRES
jgi:hypothetical protein